MSVSFYAINVFLAFYGIFLAIVGTIGNFMSFMICYQLRQTPTFVFMAFMVLVDIFTLFVWNMNSFWLAFFGLTVGDFSVFLCRFTNYIQGTSLQASSYLLVSMTIERYLSVKIRNWRNVYFKPKHAMIVSLSIIVVILCINAYILDELQLEWMPNATTPLLSCFRTARYKAWRNFNTYSFSFVPFFILACTNALLIFHVIKKKGEVNTSDQGNKNTRAMTITVIAYTFVFICFTAPFAILGANFASSLILTQEGRTLFYSFAEWEFTYHGANFFVCLITNKQFRRQFQKTLESIRIKNSSKIKPTNGTKTNNTVVCQNTK